MSADIAEAKEKLPLPGLLHRLGLGDCARKKAHCPFADHPDKNPSFSIFRCNTGEWRWHCFGCNSGGDEIEFLGQYQNLSNGDAIRRYCELAGVNGSKPPGTVFKKAKAVMSKDWRQEPKPVRLREARYQCRKHSTGRSVSKHSRINTLKRSRNGAVTRMNLCGNLKRRS